MSLQASGVTEVQCHKAALEYAGRGWPVLPIHSIINGRCTCSQGSACSTPGKHPRTINGVNDATTDREIIDKWWREFPSANVGIATGSKSGLAILDVDPRNGGDTSYEGLIIQTPLPETLKVISGGGGFHLYFGTMGKIIRSRSNFRPGIDIKGEGGYIIAPPSVHQSGERYEFDSAQAREIEIMPFPEILTEHELPNSCSAPSTSPIYEGARNNELASIAGAMRRRGATEASILTALINENLERCNPPLSEIEVRQIAKSIARYQPTEQRITGTMEHKGMTAADLLKKDIPAPNWVIPGILPQGLSLLCGKPKVGKSWLALNLWSAVAGCTDFLPNKSIERGKALYLALEDTERRLQERLKKVIDSDSGLENMVFFIGWSRSDEGGIQQLEQWLIDNPDCRLIIIDTFAKMRKKVNKSQGYYLDDYAAIAPFKEIADKFRVAIVLIHHLRKGSSEDAFEEISGTTGLSGAGDTMLVLKRARSQNSATLLITGRDVAESEFRIEIDPGSGRISLGDDFKNKVLSEERRRILDLVKTHGCLSPKEAAITLNKNESTVRVLMKDMFDSGILRKLGRGKYTA